MARGEVGDGGWGWRRSLDRIWEKAETRERKAGCLDRIWGGRCLTGCVGMRRVRCCCGSAAAGMDGWLDRWRPVVAGGLVLDEIKRGCGHGRAVWLGGGGACGRPWTAASSAGGRCQR